jgi:hypothetical protein
MTANRTAPMSSTRLGLGIASLALAAFLLIGFRTPQDVTVSGGSGTGSTGGTGGSTGGATSGSGTTGTTGTGTSGTGTSGSTGTGTSGTSGSTGGGSGAKTIDGSLVDTRYGPVQVEITVANGKVTGVSAIALPSGGRSGAISNYAAPVLSSEALTAQSATVDIVSGATYTSEGYAQSLQSALDQAGL